MPAAELGIRVLPVTVLGQYGAVPGPLDRDVWQPERLCDARHHSLQHFSRRSDGIEPLAQVSQGLGGILR